MEKKERIKELNEMKDIVLELGFWEGNKCKDLKSIDEEIERVKSSLK